MSKELAIQEAHEVTPAEMLTAAIEKGIDAAGIVALAEVFERMDARRAEREFTQAMLAFQSECPKVVKDSTVAFTTKKGGAFNAKFAKLDDVVGTVKPYLDKHGFAYAFDTKVENKQVAVRCKVSHVGGHSTVTEFSAPVDPEPALSAAHSMASACSFAQRYAFQLAFGIVTGLPDDDGRRGFTGGTISEEQQATLRTLAKDTNSLNPKFWQFCGVSSFADILSRDYARIEQALLQRKKGGVK